MAISRQTLALAVAVAASLVTDSVFAQIDLPRTAATARLDTTSSQLVRTEAPLVLKANLRSRMLVVQRADSTLKTYAVAVGQDGYPTPIGRFTIRKIVWNPSWKPPPGSDWAKGKTAKDPGDPRNPMKVVKIFFQEPDYY